MAVRTTVDIPDPVHQELRRLAESTGTSIRSLIVRALVQTYSAKHKPKYVTGPLVPKRRGKVGPDFPIDENPHDFIFS